MSDLGYQQLYCNSLEDSAGSKQARMMFHVISYILKHGSPLEKPAEVVSWKGITVGTSLFCFRMENTIANPI
ncbi:MAG: hypothetical protein OXN24_05285 [Candidatus Dadabacteria bacterium]|nr:hypothetical protein [Candidatus Dadabacteria bacterium]